MTTPTRNKLLKLAKEAGLSIGTAYGEMPALERFAALLFAHQAQGEREPVAEVVSGHAAGLYDELPIGPLLYLTPPSSDQVWNEAVEAAQKVCRNNQRNDGDEAYDQGCRDCATLLDSLKRPSQAQEQAPQVGNFGDSSNEQLSRRLESVPLPNYLMEDDNYGGEN